MFLRCTLPWEVFYQISHIHSTDSSAVANIDLFPGKQSIFLCSVPGILNLLRSANTHLEQCSSLCGCIHCTHTRPCSHSPEPLSFCLPCWGSSEISLSFVDGWSWFLICKSWQFCSPPAAHSQDSTWEGKHAQCCWNGTYRATGIFTSLTEFDTLQLQVKPKTWTI